MLWYCILPVTSEHCVCFSWSCLTISKNCEIIALRNLTKIASEMLKNFSLTFNFCNGLIKFSFDNRYRVSCDFYSFLLTYNKCTSYYTSTTSFVPSSAPTSGRTLMNTLMALDFSMLSFCMYIIISGITTFITIWKELK